MLQSGKLTTFAIFCYLGVTIKEGGFIPSPRLVLNSVYSSGELLKHSKLIQSLKKKHISSSKKLFSEGSRPKIPKMHHPKQTFSFILQKKIKIPPIIGYF